MGTDSGLTDCEEVLNFPMLINQLHFNMVIGEIENGKSKRKISVCRCIRPFKLHRGATDSFRHWWLRKNSMAEKYRVFMEKIYAGFRPGQPFARLRA